jgi:hypothetical protein
MLKKSGQLESNQNDSVSSSNQEDHHLNENTSAEEGNIRILHSAKLDRSFFFDLKSGVGQFSSRVESNSNEVQPTSTEQSLPTATDHLTDFQKPSVEILEPMDPEESEKGCSWACVGCTFLNVGKVIYKCDICDTPNPNHFILSQKPKRTQSAVKQSASDGSTVKRKKMN